jgi:Protein of unknown function (DUF2384)
MNVKPLAETYEKLKELRRQADLGEDVASLLQDFERLYDVGRDSGPPGVVPGEIPIPEGLIRKLEIKTLADRIFGDPAQADAWLIRPSAALSGQRPVDLIRDELGTAVVREMLEQIDHGIFA